MDGIRRLGPDDAAAFHALRLEGFRRFPRQFRYAPEDEDGLPLAQVERRLAEQFVAGAFVSGALAGIAGLSRFAGARLRHKGLLWGMYVRPEAQGTGLGGALVNAVLDHARGQVQTVQLTVMDHNPPARRLYERHGFVEYGREPDAVRVDGEPLDEILMIKRLA
ncbi:MAG TPA: GNAT family N-acetyltransferase [Longimicrobium sp.]|jgi:ribosomal protein S18 acetylase RimI-like enzyme|uniref:GNAT family N-acetyltransferase n=1 Tax=Longimicrobium sp. TaxID=2029185 RepID=UPI002ED900F7